jgi:hypothetical protein
VIFNGAFVLRLLKVVVGVVVVVAKIIILTVFE